MIVAKQFIAWNRSNQEPVPEGRYDPSRAFVHHPRSEATATNQSYRPSGTDRLLDAFQAINWPGYDHPVPPGQAAAIQSVPRL
jgi:hypothetical protein